MDQAYLVARAYAVLGLAPGCSQRDAARQYKQLVKRWHPDHFANDPQGQAEATARMREINHAYALVRHLGTRPAANSQVPRAGPPLSSPPPEAVSAEFHPRLTQEEIEAIAAAVGTRSFFDTLFRFTAIAGCAVGGLVMLLYGTRCPSINPFRNCAHAPARTAFGVALLCVPTAALLRAIWKDPGAARRTFFRALVQRIRLR